MKYLLTSYFVVLFLLDLQRRGILEFVQVISEPRLIFYYYKHSDVLRNLYKHLDALSIIMLLFVLETFKPQTTFWVLCCYTVVTSYYWWPATFCTGIVWWQ
jgi:hypothetical protein